MNLQSNQAGNAQRAIDLFAIAAMTEGQPLEQNETFGSRMREAREARGLALEACAHALKLPARVLGKLEEDRHDGIDSTVYLASYITKYARFLGIEQTLIDAELERVRRSGAPALVATGGVSHSRYLLERYATAATYVVLTAVIVVPMIWLGVRGTLDRDLSHLAPLDSRPVAQQDAGTAAGKARQPAGKPAPAASGGEQPLLASMAPFPNLEGSLSTAPPASANVPAATVPAGQGQMAIDLSAPSWVEITAADGTRLEYGLLPAGTHKRVPTAQAVDVRIGNADGATVTLEGRPLPLSDFRHANVAHFRVSDGKATPAGG